MNGYIKMTEEIKIVGELIIAENVYGELRAAARLHFQLDVAHTQEALALLIDRINWLEQEHNKVKTNLKKSKARTKTWRARAKEAEILKDVITKMEEEHLIIVTAMQKQIQLWKPKEKDPGPEVVLCPKCGTNIFSHWVTLGRDFEIYKCPHCKVTVETGIHKASKKQFKMTDPNLSDLHDFTTL